MSRPSQLVDASQSGDVDLSNMGFSAKEMEALGQTVDPKAVLNEHRQQSANEQTAMERYELERMQAENERLRQQVGSTEERLNQVQSGFDNISGQLSAMQQAQLAAAQQAQLDNQYALTDDELTNHGEVVPIIEKSMARMRAEMQAEYDQRLAREKEAWKQEATAPLVQELEQTKAAVQAQQVQASQQFEANLSSTVAELGFGDINTMVQMPEFQSFHTKPLYPGSSKTWGQEIASLTEQRSPQALRAIREMLTAFRDNHTTLGRQQQSQVPTGRTPAAPLTGAASQNLAKREALTAKYLENMQSANQGTFVGGTRASYRKAQAALQAQIDAIPAT